MKTLIINGSPRKKGDTRYLIQKVTEQIEGDIKYLNAYEDNIKPCVDCRYCFTKEGCAFQDDMQAVYDYIVECDHIIIASPIYFGELSGQLLAVLSRFQTYFSARYLRKEEPIKKKKTGGIILTAGSFGPREKAEDTAKFLLKVMNTESKMTIYVDKTDSVPINTRNEIIEEAITLGKHMNQLP